MTPSARSEKMRIALLVLLLIGLGVGLLVARGSWRELLASLPGIGTGPVQEERNWIWRPTPEDLNWAEGVEGGALHVRGPIVDEATDEPITARVLINGELVAKGVREVDVLMWGTAERPVFLRVEAEGHNPWEFRFRFRKEGLGEMEGPIQLKAES